MNKKITSTELALVGLFAAIIFVATFILKFEIITPTGPVMIKTSNALCILAGILLGKFYGGFASGIGSMLFDFTNPVYISGAPFTFVFFFLMAFIAGSLFEKLKIKGSLAISATIAAFSYTTLYFTKSVISTLLMGSAFTPAVMANFLKLGTSIFNAITAIILTIVFYPVFLKIFKLAGIKK